MKAYKKIKYSLALSLLISTGALSISSAYENTPQTINYESNTNNVIENHNNENSRINNGNNENSRINNNKDIIENTIGNANKVDKQNKDNKSLNLQENKNSLDTPHEKVKSLPTSSNIVAPPGYTIVTKENMSKSLEDLNNSPIGEKTNINRTNFKNLDYSRPISDVDISKITDKYVAINKGYNTSDGKSINSRDYVMVNKKDINKSNRNEFIVFCINETKLPPNPRKSIDSSYNINDKNEVISYYIRRNFSDADINKFVENKEDPNLRQNISKVILSGYGNNRMNFKGNLSDYDFREVTQEAIWYFTKKGYMPYFYSNEYRNSLQPDGIRNCDSNCLKRRVFEKLVGKENTVEVDKNFNLILYEYIDEKNPYMDDKEYQNFLGIEILKEKIPEPKKIIPWTPLTPAKKVIPWTPLTPAKKVIPWTPLTPAKKVIPWTPLTPAKKIVVSNRPSRPTKYTPNTPDEGITIVDSPKVNEDPKVELTKIEKPKTDITVVDSPKVNESQPNKKIERKKINTLRKKYTRTNKNINNKHTRTNKITKKLPKTGISNNIFVVSLFLLIVAFILNNVKLTKNR